VSKYAKVLDALTEYKLEVDAKRAKVRHEQALADKVDWDRLSRQLQEQIRALRLYHFVAEDIDKVKLA
jgi:hypothetical protein